MRHEQSEGAWAGNISDRQGLPDLKEQSRTESLVHVAHVEPGQPLSVGRGSHSPVAATRSAPFSCNVKGRETSFYGVGFPSHPSLPTLCAKLIFFLSFVHSFVL